MKSVSIKKNDTVKIISGKDEGKTGRVLRVLPSERRVLVEHVGVIKKHIRPNPQQNIKGGIAEQESAIAISNVQLICKTCGPVRVGHDHGKRVCKKCNAEL